MAFALSALISVHLWFQPLNPRQFHSARYSIPRIVTSRIMMAGDDPARANPTGDSVATHAFADEPVRARLLMPTHGATQLDEVPRILAIDYGRKRIGLALSDELGLTAQPHATLTRTNRKNDLRRLRDICRKHAVRRILVGHPLHITGEAGEMAREAAIFAARLRKEIGVEVELADERLTTWEAHQTMAEVKSPWRKRTGAAIDDVAAAVLLRDYLERKHADRVSASAEKE
jgi:putative Holliday junction resolvase